MQTFYQACLLERYHWFLEKKRNSVAKEFAERMSAACTHLPHDLLPIKMRELQGKMQKELEDVDIEENTANVGLNFKCYVVFGHKKNKRCQQ